MTDASQRSSQGEIDIDMTEGITRVDAGFFWLFNQAEFLTKKYFGLCSDSQSSQHLS
jgi:hypothetical protein